LDDNELTEDIENTFSRPHDLIEINVPPAGYGEKVSEPFISVKRGIDVSSVYCILLTSSESFKKSQIVGGPRCTVTNLIHSTRCYVSMTKVIELV
jgi:hypothetical protein